MTKRELVTLVAEKTGFPQAEVAWIVDSIFHVLSEALIQGLRWELRDFGVFEVKIRESRTGRNPRTGVQVPVPKRRVVTFRPGKLMRLLVANGPTEEEQHKPSEQSQTPSGGVTNGDQEKSESVTDNPISS